MNAGEFLTFAKSQVGLPTNPLPSTSEAGPRSAVSRAYYSLFHQAVARLLTAHNAELIRSLEEDIGQRTPGFRISSVPLTAADLDTIDSRFHPSMHKVVSVAITRVNSRLGMRLRSYRDDRNEADYRLGNSFPQAKAIPIVQGIELTINQVSMA